MSAIDDWNLFQVAMCAARLLVRCRECADDSWKYVDGDQFSDWETRLRKALEVAGYGVSESGGLLPTGDAPEAGAVDGPRAPRKGVE